METATQARKQQFPQDVLRKFEKARLEGPSQIFAEGVLREKIRAVKNHYQKWLTPEELDECGRRARKHVRDRYPDLFR